MNSPKNNFIAIATILLSASIFIGCDNENNSKKDKAYFLRGVKLESERKFENAEKFYIKAFIENNDNNDVIYRLGFIYECYLNEPELAAYYYKKLLNLNISEDEKENIKEKISNIEKDKQAIIENSTTIKDLNTNNEKLNKEVNDLNNRNKQLMEINRRLIKEIAKYKQKVDNKSPSIVAKEENVTKEKEPSEQVSSNIYIVEAGDNLGKIASKKLGMAKDWRLILEANKELLKNNEKNLRPGMKLIIPNLANDKVEQIKEDDDDIPKG